LPLVPYFISYKLYHSSEGSDIDNFLKLFNDILSKKYGFNDNKIYKIEIEKFIVKKGSEAIEFKIEHYE
jgi:Holliday junction resolvase RusA-like endonuclease